MDMTKGLNADIDVYCKTCHTCQISKLSNHTLYRTLRTLNIPNYPWEVIGIDFVGPLPESKIITGQYDMILVIIDHLSLMVHLVPAKQEYRAKDIAELLFDHVYKHHGMPHVIISDWDSLFTSQFW